MIKVCLENNKGYKWFEYKIEDRMIWVKGFFMLDNIIYKSNDFAQYIGKLSEEEYINTVKRADGQYTIIIVTSQKSYVFVDHMRSFPVFYWMENSKYVVSDNISIEKCKTLQIDNDQQEMFLNSTFTFKEKTIFAGIKQIPAGRVCVFSDDLVEMIPYWIFSYTDIQICDKNRAFDDIILGYDKLFKLCNELIENKDIVIPLSGGYDSRLVLNGLIKAGINKERILTFTYGSENAEDTMISKRIAETIGVKHIFVNYNEKKAKHFFRKEFRNFALYASNGSSIPCIQEWYAVNELKNRKLINQNSVFIPGYGGILPGHYIKEIFFSNDNLYQTIFKQLKNTFLIVSPREKETVKERLAKEILQSDYFDEFRDKNSNKALLSCYERFIYAEEQAKFIQNATRDYELVGCEWITPFLFKQQFVLWSQIDNCLRLNNKIFLECMEAYLEPKLLLIPFTGSKVKNSNHMTEGKLRKLFKLIFQPSKNHYIFALFPYKTYITCALRKMGANVNYAVGVEVIKNYKKI